MGTDLSWKYCLSCGERVIKASEKYDNPPMTWLRVGPDSGESGGSVLKPSPKNQPPLAQSKRATLAAKEELSDVVLPSGEIQHDQDSV